MITRQIARRHGRTLAVTHLVRLQVYQRRNYAQEVDGIEQSVDNALRETHSIERALDATSPRYVPKIQDETYQRLDPETAKIAEKYNILQHHKQTTGFYGASIGKHYRPNDVLNDPPSPSEITPELLLASQAHMGHATSLWNPMNSKYIHGVREGIHIISLEETMAHLRIACKVVSGVAERAGLVVFAGTKRGQEQSVVLAAKLSKGYHVFNRWMSGAITNKQQILGSYKLKLVDENDRELTVNPEMLRQASAPIPDLVVCLNPKENWVLLHECALNNIPTIGIIDTDADPTWVTYPIPANDDSLRCTNLIAGVLGRAGEEGQRIRKERTSRGDVPYDPFELPDNDAIGETYNRRLDSDKNAEYEIEYRDENDQLMTKEQFEELQQQGVSVDDSMMEVFMDENSGDPRDATPYVFDGATGETRQVPYSEFDEMREEDRPDEDDEMEGFGRPSRTQDTVVSARPSEIAAVENDGTVMEAPAGADQINAQAQKEMEQVEEADAIQAANKVPEDAKQKALDDEKKEKSH